MARRAFLLLLLLLLLLLKLAVTHNPVRQISKKLDVASRYTSWTGVMPTFKHLRGGADSSLSQNGQMQGLSKLESLELLIQNIWKKILASNDEAERDRLRAEEGRLQDELAREERRMELKQLRDRILASNDEAERDRLKTEEGRLQDELKNFAYNVPKRRRHEESSNFEFDETSPTLRFLMELRNLSCVGNMSTSATSVQMPQVSMQFVGETLLIRQCYRDVKKIIADNFGLDEITLKQREKLNYFRTLIISGNPGIGKSCFAYYLLLYILQTGENVYYQIADTHYFFKPSEGKWYRVISERMFQERLLFKCRGWYLCDFDPSVKTYFHEDSVKSIVFTSPKANIFKQILKEGKARKYFLPVWTDEEISIFLDMHKTRVNLEKAKKRIEEWGNIPRMILSEANESLAQEIGKLNSLKDLEDQLNAVMDEDLNLPSKLVHLTPGPTYNYVTAKVCSELAKGCIYSRMMKKDRERAIEAAFSKDDGEKLSDWTLFECFSHDILKKGGMKNVRRLGKRPEECFAEEIRLVRSNVFEFLGGIESLNRVLRKQTYYKPASKNFPCVDALSLSEVPGELLLFQMTKANQHSISRTLLHDILTNVSARNNISRVNLVFVLPECQANAKSWKHTQSLKDGSNLKSRRGSFEDLGIELLQSALFLSRRDIE